EAQATADSARRHARTSGMRLALVAVALALPAAAARGEPHPLGLAWAGALAGGVQLPAAGSHFFTWDPVLRRAPDRPWRRYATDRLLRILLRVVDAYASAHPSAPRLGIGALS